MSYDEFTAFTLKKEIIPNSKIPNTYYKYYYENLDLKHTGFIQYYNIIYISSSDIDRIVNTSNLDEGLIANKIKKWRTKDEMNYFLELCQNKFYNRKYIIYY